MQRESESHYSTPLETLPKDGFGPSKATHEVRIADCQAVKHEDGYAVITWTFEYLSGPNAGKQFLDVSRLKSDAAKKYFRDVCDRLGSPFREGDRISVKCPTLAGKKVKLDIITRTSMYISDVIADEEDFFAPPLDLGFDDIDLETLIASN